uniref:Matrix remodeling-associated protein 8 n=1 Tax=Sus scrofa TaxID=9823 RepID=A0A8D1DAR3_PIG
AGQREPAPCCAARARAWCGPKTGCTTASVWSTGTSAAARPAAPRTDSWTCTRRASSACTSCATAGACSCLPPPSTTATSRCSSARWRRQTRGCTPATCITITVTSTRAWPCNSWSPTTVSVPPLARAPTPAARTPLSWPGILDRLAPPAQAAGAHWTGEKEVLVVERGAPALLTCVNRAHVWTDRHLEEAQQVVHWDRQPPGVPHDRADRLLDLYASGERRAYGPPFLRDRVAVGADAFARGDFSLRIDPLEPADEGTYSCHLHHHYCGLHERRIFHLRVTEPAAEPPPRDSPGNGSSHGGAPGPDPTLARGRSVINVIVPEGRAHFFQQLGYVLATLLLFILLLITVVLATRQRRRGGYEYSDKKSKSKGKDVNVVEFAVATGDQALYRSENIQLDYKNNILKERAELVHSPPPPKNIDLDKEFRKEHCR